LTKLLFIGSFPNQSQGGTSTASLSLKKALTDLGIEVFGIDSTIRDVVKNTFVSRLKRGWKRSREIKSVLNKHNPSHALIFCGHGLSFIEKAWWMLRFKRKGLITFLAPRSGLILKSMKRRWFKRIVKYTIRFADYVLCQGKYWTDFYSKFAPNQISKFIDFPNWIDSDQTLAKHNYKNETFRILVVGWLNEDKGVLDIIPIAKSLQKSIGKPFTIELYGKGPLKKKLLHEIVKHGLTNIVKIHEWKTQTELWNEFNTSSLLLFLSRYEGMPNSLMEATALGLPVVSTNISTVPEIIEEGQNGYLCEPGDIDSFVNRISELINKAETRDRMSKNALMKAAQFSSPQSAAQIVLDLINNPNKILKTSSI